ncbi:hypothetical protein CBS101457_002422 [Exobasidium rhododendri]|nr:hypothetical protein CBS101457_002422 [Exobasidium rhododendri]
MSEIAETVDTVDTVDTVEKNEEKSQDSYRLVEGKERFLQTVEPFTTREDCDLGRKRSQRLGQYEGLRGILMVLSLIWTFFRIFAPAIVADRDLDQVYPAAFLSAAPQWQHILRKALSPLLFNESLLASFFVILSTRVCLQTYIERRDAECMAGAIFRRPFRLAGPCSLALAFCSVFCVSGAFKYADEVSLALSNQSAAQPRIWESTVTYFNSCVGLLMDISMRRDARGSSFLPPGSTGWIIPVIFQQTYCVAVISYMLPYSVLRWKIKGGIMFGLAAFWSGRWVWYSTFAIFLTEFSVVYKPLLAASWTLKLYKERTCQVKQQVLPFILLAIGAALKYSWASIPTHRDDELVARVDPTSGALDRHYDVLVASPRIDDFLVVSAVFLLIELTPGLTDFLNRRSLRFLGSLAFSSFLTSGTIMLAVGSALHHHLSKTFGWNSHNPVLVLILFVCSIPSACVFSLLWRITVDDGTLAVARSMYRWVIKP